ncbi:KTSC domain-containing protein [Levilactobacillus enshiensis]|uniref:KTSC domain-containing protein n=1 Tax=Levilactobacillus enshiensis TaxID=2590213 RepID=UPI00131B62E3|nr:KTSC domain-containing protein [Levilactobacillus enshiensis]
MKIRNLSNNATRQHFQLHYNEPAELLEVRIITGEIYVYRDVSRSTYQHFSTAADPVAYYRDSIVHHGHIQIRFNRFQLSDVGRNTAKLLPLNCHLIISIAYDNNQRLLLVNLLEKTQLLYPNVPREIVEMLLHAPDQDRFYLEMIVLHYPCCAVR